LDILDDVFNRGSWKVRFSAWLAGVQNWLGRLIHIMTGITIQAEFDIFPVEGIIIQAGILDMHAQRHK